MSCACGVQAQYGDELCRECKRREKSGELQELREYFHEPVVPLSVVCDAITTWARAIEQGVRETPAERRQLQQGAAYAEYIGRILIDIRKSGLLSRVIYNGEGVRTEKCPVHQGHMDCAQWVGLGDPTCCDGSGWLETDLKVREQRLEAVRVWKQREVERLAAARLAIEGNKLP